jgi:hypothetical protein
MTKNATKGQRIQVQILARVGHSDNYISEMTTLSNCQVSKLPLIQKKRKETNMLR